MNIYYWSTPRDAFGRFSTWPAEQVACPSGRDLVTDADIPGLSEFFESWEQESEQ